MIDALGLRCPLPVIRLEAALRAAAPGQRVAIRTDDPIASVDVPHAAASGGHACARLSPPGTAACVFMVTCAAERSAEARPGV